MSCAMSWSFWFNADVLIGQADFISDRVLGATGSGVEGYIIGSSGGPSTGDLNFLIEDASGNYYFAFYSQYHLNFLSSYNRRE